MIADSNSHPASLAWTGERMVPHRADAATELFHWQRYLYFRPWYQGAKVIDAASGEGYGLGYAATFAKSAVGIEIAPEAVEHAARRYPRAQFLLGDVTEADYSSADLVVSFETIEHLPDPAAFLRQLGVCPGRVVISTPNRDTHSPGNRLTDQPFNGFHTVEWTPSEFAQLVQEHFPDRQVRFLSQEARWPGLIREGLDKKAMYTIAVIGDGELPKWPRLGIAMPTHNGAQRVQQAIAGMTKLYPGELEFAVVANGCDAQNLRQLRQLQSDLPHVAHLIEQQQNRGYGVGANLGLEFLSKRQSFDLFGVTNDDVTPSTDFLPQLVTAYHEMAELGLRPGLIGPVTNEISGAQRVDIGAYTSIEEMQVLAESYHALHHSSATPALQVRGLFLLIDPGCLRDIGGFDPRFGLGNFEDDDYNLRARLAGYTLWIVDGAFLHHDGSATFRSIGLDYDLNIQRNLALFLEKWEQPTMVQALQLTELPAGAQLFVPLCSEPAQSGFSLALSGEQVDLVHQASPMEFAAYVHSVIASRPRDSRVAVLQALKSA